MTRKIFSIVAIVVLIALFGGLFAAQRYVSSLPERVSQQETVLLGRDRFVPGSQAVLRLLVRNTRDSAPLDGADVTVSLMPAVGGTALTVYNGKTDAKGAAEVSFVVPEGLDPEQTLRIETRSRIGADVIERPVRVEREYRVLLSTDKPIYQPGQVIHLRALALSAFDLTPAAGQSLDVTIADGKGNKVFRKQLTASDFGAAWTDFRLADEVNTGNYKISAVMGNTASEKTVVVERYVLPKFDVTLQPEQPYYQPGQRVNVSLNAGYFFGKPVDGAEVQIQGYTFDVQRSDVFTLSGVTDDAGRYDFSFDLPAYLAGSDLDSGLARFYLQAAVTDGARHTEIRDLSLPVSASGLVVEAVPEGGRFRPGVENILYLLASYPDGSPAEADIVLNFYDSGQLQQVRTSAYGLAEVRYTPVNPYVQFNLSASDAQGHSVTRDFYFEGEWSYESLLLRPDSPIYAVGDTMNLQVFSTQQSGTVYFDIVRDGQTVSTRSVTLENGRAEIAVDLTPDLYGTLELHVYDVKTEGNIVRDTRLVVVDRAAGLNVAITPGQETYLPGDTAALNIAVTAPDGQGKRAALGLAIVDEAVFALAEQDPGFARLYFLLESEILTPRFDLHGLSLPERMSGGLLPTDPTLKGASDTAAFASLADAVANTGAGFSLTANSRQEALKRVYQLQTSWSKTLALASAGLYLLVAAGLLASVIVPLARGRIFWRSLLLTIGVLSFLFVVLMLFPLGPDFAWATSPGDRISVIANRMSPAVLLGLGAAALLGYVGLIIAAIARRDAALGWTMGLLSAFVAAMVLMVFMGRSVQVLEDGLLIAILSAFLLAPAALWVRAAGFVLEKRPLMALAALPTALVVIVSLVPMAGGAMAPTAGNVEMEFARDGQLMGAVEEAVPAAAIPVMNALPEKSASGAAEPGQTAAAPRLRQYFPETMLWLPDAETGPDGQLVLDVPVADSITTWRITALASSADGQMGSVDAPLRVFQDFFIDLDLPLSLTVGDEIAVPVGVFNYLPEAQTVRLELQQEAWFELLDEPVKEVQIGPNEISAVYFRVKARDFGMQPFQVTAIGTRMSDAIRRQVRVYADGKPIRAAVSDRLDMDTPLRVPVTIPAGAVPGTQSVVVKIYPGVLSQVVEGLDAILRMPFGCFEQTSSTTYPNVLVLDYLRSTGQAAPEAEMKAEEYINLGYQRLATFEVGSSGGFSLFGDAPADRMLTAYGLQEFADMSKVYDVDPDLVRRAANWLMSEQNADGSWNNDRGLVHEGTWASLGDDRVPVSAYIVWSLIDAGFEDESAVQKGLDFLRENYRSAKDAYVVALLANALTAGDLAGGSEISSTTQAVLDQLAGLAQQDGRNYFWPSGVATFTGAQGNTGSIETTALAAYVFLRADVYSEQANGALTYLVGQKDTFGTWYSTQATVLTLKALLQSVRAGGDTSNASVTLRLNGSQERTLQVTPENFDVVQMVSFEDVNVGGENVVEIEASGSGKLMYQVTSAYTLPWERLAEYPELVAAQDLVSIDVAYDRTELAVDDTVEVSVQVKLNQPGASAEQAMIDLGLPPGFSLLSEDLDALVTRYNDTLPDDPQPKIQRYEQTGRQVLVYITNLSADRPLQFSYRLRARFPLRAQAPASSAYDYYDPDVQGEQAPQVLVVNER